MRGTFEGFKVTFGSFGQQYTTIDGQVYLTWFDAGDPELRRGAKRANETDGTRRHVTKFVLLKHGTDRALEGQ